MHHHGTAHLVAFGRRFPVDARIDGVPGSSAWSGVLRGPLDWEYLLRDDPIALDVPAANPMDPPCRYPITIDLIVGDAVAVHCGDAAVAHRQRPHVAATA